MRRDSLWNKHRRGGVSHIIATILLVAISVITATVVFAAVQRFTNTTQAPPIAVGTTSTVYDDHVVISVVSGVAPVDKCYVILKNSGGLSVEGYNYKLPDIQANSTSAPLPDRNITWVDNNENGKLDPGDSFWINIESTTGNELGRGEYTFIVIKDSLQIIVQPFKIGNE